MKANWRHEQKENSEIKNSGKHLFSNGFDMDMWIKANWRRKQEHQEIQNSGKHAFSYCVYMEMWIKANWRNEKNENSDIKNSEKHWFPHGFDLEKWTRANWRSETRENSEIKNSGKHLCSYGVCYGKVNKSELTMWNEREFINKEFRKACVSYGCAMERRIKANWRSEKWKSEIKNSGKHLFSYGFAMGMWIKANWRSETRENSEIKNSGKHLCSYCVCYGKVNKSELTMWNEREFLNKEFRKACVSYGCALERWIKANWQCEMKENSEINDSGKAFVFIWFCDGKVNKNELTMWT